MKKILMLPLDERPCNYNYPSMMPKADYTLVLPPKDIMGDKKNAGDTDKIRDWLLANVKDADACILSLDTLIYGGIVPSRLHHDTVETLIERSNTVEELRKLNPKMKFYLFQLIMRCPGYSLSDEEPDYYDECGEELHLYGRYMHKASLDILTADEEKDFERVKAKIKPEYLKDFTERRAKNLEVLMHNLEYVKRGVCDFFIVPQDDAAEYGFTSIDQLKVREYIKSNVLHLKTAMYPSADDTGLILLGRAVAALNGVKPKIFVHYASAKATTVIPWFEDRALDETVKFHVLSVGGIRVYSLEKADVVLVINMGSGMYHEWQGEYAKAYDVERSLAEITCFTKYALSKNKVVAIGDVATCNGADPEFFNMLYDEDLLLKIHAYAGWNTSSNTLGTTVCQAVIYLVGKDRKGTDEFLLHRYYEDLGYMGYARKYVTDNVLPELGLNYFKADGKIGKVSEAVRKAVEGFMLKNYPKVAEKVEEVYVEMPWRRMFEADIKLKTNL